MSPAAGDSRDLASGTVLFRHPANPVSIRPPPLRRPRSGRRAWGHVARTENGRPGPVICTLGQWLLQPEAAGQAPEFAAPSGLPHQFMLMAGMCALRVVGWKPAPGDVHILIPRAHEYVTHRCNLRPLPSWERQKLEGRSPTPPGPGKNRRWRQPDVSRTHRPWAVASGPSPMSRWYSGGRTCGQQLRNPSPHVEAALGSGHSRGRPQCVPWTSVDTMLPARCPAVPSHGAMCRAGLPMPTGTSGPSRRGAEVSDLRPPGQRQPLPGVLPPSPLWAPENKVCVSYKRVRFRLQLAIKKLANQKPQFRRNPPKRRGFKVTRSN